MRAILALGLAVLAGCNHRPHSYPDLPMTPEVAVDSTFMVIKYVSGTEDALGVGTAWIVKSDSTDTYLVSAGHVCQPGLIPVDFRVKPSDSDTEIPAAVVKWSLNPDLCVIRANSYLGPALRISSVDPKRGDRVSYTGAPLGLWHKVTPIFEGIFIGYPYIAAPTIGGASGSAIFTDQGVIGVLITVDSRFHHIVGIVPRSQTIDFLQFLNDETYNDSLQTTQPQTEAEAVARPND